MFRILDEYTHQHYITNIGYYTTMHAATGSYRGFVALQTEPDIDFKYCEFSSGPCMNYIER